MLAKRGRDNPDTVSMPNHKGRGLDPIGVS